MICPMAVGVERRFIYMRSEPGKASSFPPLDVSAGQLVLTSGRSRYLTRTRMLGVSERAT
jgi:hypothetical protein